MSTRQIIRLDGSGGRTSPHREPVGSWIQLNWEDRDDRAWLEDEAGVDELVADSLLAEDTRPRVVEHENGLILILRGVNLNPGQDPEDMISLRLWFDGERLISTSRYPLRTVAGIVERLDEGTGPASLAELLLELIEGLTDRIDELIESIEEEIDELEAALLEGADRELRDQIGQVRRTVIVIRRYLAPERDALVRLTSINRPILAELDRGRIREQADALTRLVEDLDMARERGSMIHEQLLTRLSDQLNTRMYLLSIVAAIFLPLGFLTGLFGINVGGMPWVETDLGFWWVTLLVALIAGGLGIWLKRRRWF
ncbi:zinc transporter ZntB [Guyparkeria hydrothermalis]|uniref:zinc transporter ZntB n=1 Tax=Guyparkeria hydrothermalis TaxID=923 RepID=UPI002022182B|nr:zinc transporter ZntB [Guyparkeria hydrothermalis]MCL7744108.1 zinc transporter ZntB [Guyparkeria hydrothermalis]